ncbi:nucleic-acid-binding protein from transposon X-element [Trichonephila clavipes]|nr:nucleic-acid-binding protein from transposon X-element [Trichonephila clavipes]
MADNKQLKAVIRGIPTDYDQKEIATELKGFGFDADHISILRNRKNNTNMPLFLVVLKRTQENKEIFHVTNIGFFRVVVEPLKGSSMPPQCYRCQEFYHHSRLCNCHIPINPSTTTPRNSLKRTFFSLATSQSD